MSGELEQEKLNIQGGVLLGPKTWWKVGGAADYFCQPSSLDQLRAVLRWGRNKQLPVTVLGGGSNVLISDEGIEGLVIGLEQLQGLEVTGETPDLQFWAWAGTAKSEAVKIFLRYKLAPAHFLCGIPGEIGGGVVMNAGVGEAIRPREFHEIVDWVEVIDFSKDELPLRRIEAKDIHWSYRHSSGWQPGLVVRVGFRWPNQAEPDVMQRVREATKNRVAKQPLNLPSCGSVFKNPPGGKAGALIERCGLKGYSVGGAQVSEKHANFIVNIKQAKARDIDRLIQFVQSEVVKQTGVSLQTEVKYLGRW